MAKSTQLQTAETLVKAFNSMDIDTIISLRAPTCLRQILPAALGHKPTTNDQYRASLYKLKPIFQNFSLVVRDVTEDASARKIVMYLSARADTVAGEYVNEYMWTMRFDVEGRQIVEWTEFVDALVNREFWPKLAAAMRVYHQEGAVVPEDA